MNKMVIMIIIVTLTFALLTACTSTELSSDFDSAVVESSAQGVVDALNAKDYDSVVAMLREDLQDRLNAQKIADAVEMTYGDAGEFTAINKTTVIGQKKEDEDFAVAIIEAKYENKKVIFTLSYDKNMKLIGLYMK
ncbi:MULTISPECIES: DUF3887 domain-containing protein [unclassified Fusibacter]|uniref:DUF3887 domain-containing protein n=1 Tax=unclassified Fusibacter TaxID=2624464 RepID=UPI0010127966|nr:MULTISPECIES: DUF3887 domain-containing protein [unclassified Fusibacter]MCK8058156.1 DUF3887 domain-containing protein [Fusibacter sp. A2]NPE20738.1 DUF3887 domain-containing protein [Fusibacter sp. A1]RXV62944.1 DUF3887 domain-containing protein [Fusibacter sp. A1]